MKLFIKKHSKKFFVFLTLAIIAGAIIFYFAAYKVVDTVVNTPSQDEKIVLNTYGYTLPNNPTAYQKELYDELVEMLNSETVTGIDHATQIAKIFVADFYTWTNKEGTYDVGGMDYVASGHGHMFRVKAMDTVYYYLSDYVYEYGNTELLEVTNITVSSAEYSVFRNGDTVVHDNTYYIHLNWEYAASEVFDTSEFQHEMYLQVYEEDGKMRILEVYQ